MAQISIIVIVLFGFEVAWTMAHHSLIISY